MLWQRQRGGRREENEVREAKKGSDDLGLFCVLLKKLWLLSP